MKKVISLLSVLSVLACAALSFANEPAAAAEGEKKAEAAAEEPKQ